MRTNDPVVRKLAGHIIDAREAATSLQTCKPNLSRSIRAFIAERKRLLLEAARREPSNIPTESEVDALWDELKAQRIAKAKRLRANRENAESVLVGLGLIKT